MESGLYDLDVAIQNRKMAAMTFEQEKLRWLAQIFLGLEHMHRFSEKPIVHRDMKPGNVIIFDDYRVTSRAKVTDFGCSRAHDLREGTTTRGIFGSNGYMAPEVLDAGFEWEKQAGVLADLFSLGAIAYHLVTEEPPPGVGNSVTIPENLQNAKELRDRVSQLPDGDWKDFIERLTKPQAEKEKRMRHDAIRSHQLLEQFGLPPYEKSQDYREAALSYFEEGTPGTAACASA